LGLLDGRVAAFGELAEASELLSQLCIGASQLKLP